MGLIVDDISGRHHGQQTYQWKADARSTTAAGHGGKWSAFKMFLVAGDTRMRDQEDKTLGRACHALQMTAADRRQMDIRWTSDKRRTVGPVR